MVSVSIFTELGNRGASGVDIRDSEKQILWPRTIVVRGLCFVQYALPTGRADRSHRAVVRLDERCSAREPAESWVGALAV